jgi:hypothetical protein
LNKGLKRFVSVFWGLLMGGTLLLMLGMPAIWHVAAAKPFPMENGGYLMIGLLIAGLLFFVNHRWGGGINAFLARYGRILLFLSMAAVLVFNLYAAYGGYFNTGWDAGIVRSTALLEFYKHYARLPNNYFSWFPNNQLIVWLFTGVLRIGKAFGMTHLEYALVVFQVIVGVLSLWLVYAVTLDLTKNHKIAWMAYLAALLLSGLTPWIIVAYSDATGIIFPLVTIRCYQMAGKTAKPWAKIIWWALLGLSAFAGYRIKPQTVIMLIAVVLVELCSLFYRGSFKKLGRVALRLGLAAGGFALGMLLYTQAVQPSLHFKINPRQTIGMPHYLMMGLNDKAHGDGVYRAEDYNYTWYFRTNEARNKADLEKAQIRLEAYGPDGLFWHLCRKQIINYNDGTFGWNDEGDFFQHQPKWAHNEISPWVRSVIKPKGKNYKNFLSFKQTVWITLIFSGLFAAGALFRSESEETDKETMILIAAILGLTVFELLFEARARYLYTYAPVYAIIGTLGLRQLYWRLSVGFHHTERKDVHDSVQSGTGPVDRDSLLQRRSGAAGNGADVFEGSDPSGRGEKDQPRQPDSVRQRRVQGQDLAHHRSPVQKGRTLHRHRPEPQPRPSKRRARWSDGSERPLRHRHQHRLRRPGRYHRYGAHGRRLPRRLRYRIRGTVRPGQRHLV